MKKQVVAILIALMLIASLLLAAMLSTSVAEEPINQAIKIKYKPYEDGSYKSVTVHPKEIEIHKKDDTFFVGIDYDSDKKDLSALYLNLEYAELTPYKDYISVEIRDKTGKKGTDLAYEEILAKSDWGQLQVIVKELEGKKRTIDAHVAIFEKSSEEEIPGFEGGFAITGLLAVVYILKRRK